MCEHMHCLTVNSRMFQQLLSIPPPQHKSHKPDPTCISRLAHPTDLPSDSLSPSLPTLFLYKSWKDSSFLLCWHSESLHELTAGSLVRSNGWVTLGHMCAFTHCLPAVSPHTATIEVQVQVAPLSPGNSCQEEAMLSGTLIPFLISSQASIIFHNGCANLQFYPHCPEFLFSPQSTHQPWATKSHPNRHELEPQH